MRTLLGFVQRALLFGVLGWALVEGEAAALLPIGIAAAAAAAFSLRMVPHGRWGWRWAELVRFLPYFLRESLVGGVDVARRAFHPRLPLRPGMIDYPLRLRDESARVFFAYVVSLLPGTLSAELGDDRLLVHALDDQMPIVPRLRALEDRVARLFPVTTRAPRSFH